MSVYNRQIYGWQDNLTALTAAATGAGTPSLQAFGPTGNIKQRRFAVGDSVYLSCHWTHELKPGGRAYPHVHWSSDGTDTAQVWWQVSYITAAGFNQAAFGADTVVTLKEAGSGTAWQHMVIEDAVGILTPEVDSVTLMELKRVTNGGVDNADQIFGLFVDWHYQVGPYFGTAQRTPPFYG